MGDKKGRSSRRFSFFRENGENVNPAHKLQEKAVDYEYLLNQLHQKLDSELSEITNNKKIELSEEQKMFLSEIVDLDHYSYVMDAFLKKYEFAVLKENELKERLQSLACKYLK